MQIKIKPIIITISGQARHGKDSAAGFFKHSLEEKGFKVLKINYADYLKFLAKAYFGWDGNKDSKGRTLLQQLGTEKVRSKKPDFWVDTVINLVEAIGSDYDFIIIADCRFPNEIDKWKRLDYRVVSVHVTRVGFDNGLSDEQKNHPSETALSDYLFEIYLKAKDLNELEQAIQARAKFLVGMRHFFLDKKSVDTMPSFKMEYGCVWGKENQ